MEEVKLERQISIPHGVLLVIGFVIGAAAFILIGPLAGQTGPGLWISYLIAAIPAVFVALLCAQLGTAFPVTGATYMCVGRTVSPVLGLVMAWVLLLGVFIFNIPMMAYGFAQYLSVMIPVPIVLTSVLILVFFIGLNILGIKWMMWFQSIFTAIAIAALLVFGFGGLSHMNPEYQTPLFPLGFSAVAIAAIPAFIMYSGLNGITELGGEMRNPRRDLPLILFISLFILVVIYVAITYALTGLMPWQVLGETEGAVTVAAGKFLPAWGVYFIGIGALLAAATTINAVLAVISRDVLRLSRDLVLPSFFGKVNKRFRTPARAILLLGIISIAGVFIAETIVRYATVAALACLFMSLVIAIAIFLLPRRMNERYKASAFKLKGGWLPFISIGGACMFGIFILLGCVSDPRSAFYFLLLIATGFIYYYARRWYLRNKGIVIEDRLKVVEEI